MLSVIGEISLIIPIRYIVIGYIACVVLWLVIHRLWPVELFSLTSSVYLIGYGLYFLFRLYRNDLRLSTSSLIGQLIAYFIALFVIGVISFALEQFFDFIEFTIFPKKNKKIIMICFFAIEELVVTIVSVVAQYSFFKANFFDPNESKYEYFTDRGSFVVLVATMIVIGVLAVAKVIEYECDTVLYIGAVIFSPVVQWLGASAAVVIFVIVTALKWFALAIPIIGLFFLVMDILVKIDGGRHYYVPSGIKDDIKKIGLSDEAYRYYHERIHGIVTEEKEKRRQDSGLISLTDEGAQKLYRIYCEFCDSYPFRIGITLDAYDNIIETLFREVTFIDYSFVRDAGLARFSESSQDSYLDD